MGIRDRAWRVPLALTAALLIPTKPVPANEIDDLLRFGTEMARGGNWREAKYRWERALSGDPNDARILNNLAIAEEALGDGARAKVFFDRAIAASPRDSRISENATRSALFWRNASDPKAPPATTGSLEPPKKKGRDVVAVTVSLPLPPRMKVDGAKTFLVASFLVNDSNLVNVNREIVRFVRAEIRKHTAFEVLDINPPPAVPEQTLEDMSKNAEFFRHLGREYGADVVMSGAMNYSKRDASGFEDIDLVSETTGQKVKMTRFVEQEEFTFELDALYFEGSSGALLFKDRMKRQAIFRGTANDPISAFYELGNGIAGDVLSVVAARSLPATRLLFKG